MKIELYFEKVVQEMTKTKKQLLQEADAERAQSPV